MNSKRNGNLGALNKIKNQQDKPEWMSCDTHL